MYRKNSYRIFWHVQIWKVKNMRYIVDLIDSHFSLGLKPIGQDLQWTCPFIRNFPALVRIQNDGTEKPLVKPPAQTTSSLRFLHYIIPNKVSEVV